MAPSEGGGQSTIRHCSSLAIAPDFYPQNILMARHMRSTLFGLVVAQLFALQVTVHAQSLIDSGQELPGLWAGRATWADYDGDGDLDLSLIGETIDDDGQPLRIARIYGNDAGGIFSEYRTADQQLAGVYFGDLAWADYDGDGDLDLAIAGWNAENRESLQLYTNEEGTFDPSERFLALDRRQIDASGLSALKGVRYAALAWADYDNDGDLDLIVSGMEENGTSLTLLYRNEEGVLQIDETNSESLVNLHNGDLAWADYDNDGDIDLAVSGENVTTTGGLKAVTEFYQNEAAGVLSLDNTLEVADKVKGGALAWGDYDGDGNLDLAVNGQVTDWEAYWNTSFLLYRNRPTGVLTQDEIFRLSTTRRITGDLTWADYDNDGDPDLATSGRTLLSSYQAFVFKNEAGQLSGVSAETQLEGLAGGSTAWGDYDGDGRTDLLISGVNADGERRTLLYNNQGTLSANRLPTPPSSLNQAKVTSGRVIFSWAPGADTESSSLTYNLRVGTDPGSGDIFSGTIPPGPGNAGFKTNKALEVTLAPDVYYWSVQTVDGAFARSTWSQEDVLNIQQFVSSDQNIRALKEAAMAWGDYDDDGDLDLVVLGQNRSGEAQSLLYENVGGILTANTNASLEPLRNGAADWGDYDNDGDLDLLLTGEDTFENRRTLLYAAVPTGTGYSLELVGQFPDLSKSGAAWGDYDNDGDLDLALMGQSDDVIEGVQQSYTRIFVNDGSKSFTRSDQELIGLNNGDLAWSDYDNDGDIDLAVTGQSITSSRELRVYRNDDGILIDADLGLTGLESSDLAWGDFDGDGDADLVAGGIEGDGSLSTTIYVNDGAGGLAPLVDANIPGILGGDLAWADYDNDQDQDLIVIGNDGQKTILQIYENKDEGFVFDNILILWDQGLDFSAVSVADIEGDGDLDLISSGSTGGTDPLTFTRVNDNLEAQFNPNRPPESPSIGTAVDTGDSVQFSWQQAEDEFDITPASLTYNLRVGRSPGSGDVLSGTIPLGPGNAGHNLSHRLEGLSSDTYYWSVQSIDDGFAPSPWSAASSFVIDTVQPQVTAFNLSGQELGIGQTVNLALTFLDQHSGVDATVEPQVTATIGDQTYPFESLQFTGSTWSGALTISANMPSGAASVSVSGAIDGKGNPLVPFAEENAFTIDTDLPIVSSSLPADGTTDVSVELDEVTITFSEPLDPATVTADNFKIELGSQILEQIPEPTYDAETSTVRFFPIAGVLVSGSQYKIEISAAIQDLAGNRPDNARALAFDTRVPQLLDLFPADGDSLVPSGQTPLVATFNAPLFAAALDDAQAVQLLRENQAEPLRDQPRFSEATGELTFEPAAGLRPGSRYEVILAGNLAGPLRVQAGGDFHWSFRTVTPELLSKTPEGTGVDASTARIEATFSADIDADLLSAETIHVAREGETEIIADGSLRFDAETGILSFELERGLKPGSRYEVVLDGNLAGPLQAVGAGDFTWQFQTVVPQLLSKNPEGEIEAASERIEATFSADIDAGLLDATTVRVSREGESEIIADGSLRFDAETSILSFELERGLKPGSRYEIVIDGSLAGPLQAVGAGDFTWQFQTVVPQLLSKSPEGEIEAASERIEATFSADIDADLLSAETVRISREGETEIIADGSLRFDAETSILSFELERGLKPGSRYEVILNGSLSGPLQVVGDGDFTWQFQTIVPQLLNKSPEGTIDIAEERIQATFSADIDAGLLDATTVRITREGESETIADGSLRFDAGTGILSFELERGLKPGSRYEIVINGSLAGPLQVVGAGDFTWQFQTVVPQLLSKSPEGEVETAPERIEATFSADIDADLLNAETVRVAREGETETIADGSLRFDAETGILGFELERGLKPGSRYEIVIDGSLAGPLQVVGAGDFTWQFQMPVPQLASTSPQKGVADLSTADATLTATFDNPLDADLLVANNISLLKSGAEVAISDLDYNPDTKTARFSVAEGLRAGTGYQVRIARAVGGPLRQGAYSWSFQTAVPQVTTVLPAADAANVEIALDQVVVSFSAPLDADQVTTANFLLLREGQAVELRTDDPLPLGDGRYALAPAADWQVGSRYSVQISPTVSGPLGTGQPLGWSFSTGVPDTVAVSPAAGDSAVSSLTGTITATFDNPIDATTLDIAGNVQLLQEGRPLDIEETRYDADSRTVAIVPLGGLRAGTGYQARIGAAVGGPLRQEQGDFLWDFSTRVPSPVSVDPTDDSSTHSGARRLQVTFSGPLDRDLITPQNFRLSRSGIVVDLDQREFDYDAETYTVSFPSVDLQPGSEYQASVSSRVSGPLGGDLPDLEWTFRTQVPQVVSTWPDDGADGVSTSIPTLQVVFSEPVASQDASAFQLLARSLGDTSGAPELVAITSPTTRDSGDVVVLNFAPEAGLQPFTEYEIAVARQVLGELATSGFGWTFRTAGLLEDAVSGGTVTNASGSVELYFPPNALASGAREVLIRRLPVAEILDKFAVQQTGLTRISSAYEISAAGQLRKPVTLTLDYTETELGNSDPSTLGVFRHQSGQWQRVGGSGLAGERAVRTAVEELGVFALFEDLATPVGDLAIRALDCQPRAFAPTAGDKSETDISFELTRATDITVRVYNASGRLERVIARDEPMAPGRISLSWDGRDEDREMVASGLYIVVVNAGDNRREKVVSVVR
jgi:hypothetical protein